MSYDARTGAELWSVRGLQEQCIPTPVSLGELGVRWAAECTQRERNGPADALSVRAWEEVEGRPFPSRLRSQGRCANRPSFKRIDWSMER